MEIKDILKNRRIELNLKLEDIADKVGVTISTISRWESGDIANMKRDKIVSYAKALSISPSVIMGWEEETEVTPKPNPIPQIKPGLVEKIAKLDDIDQARIEERVDMMLEADKYSEERSLSDKVG